MGVIADKIKDNKLFFKFILIAEITYLLAFAGLVCPSIEAIFVFCFFAMFLNFLIFFTYSFFNTKIRPIKKEIILLFLFRLCLIFFVFYFLVEFHPK